MCIYILGRRHAASFGVSNIVIVSTSDKAPMRVAIRTRDRDLGRPECNRIERARSSICTHLTASGTVGSIMLVICSHTQEIRLQQRTSGPFDTRIKSQL